MAISPRKAVKKVLAEKQDQLRAWPMQLGDNDGNIAVPDRANYVYVHDESGQVTQAYCPAQLNQYNLPVLVGYDPYQPGVFQIIGVRQIGGATPINATAKHGSTHEWLGGDTVWVQLRQFMPLRVTPAGGLNIAVMRTVTWLGNQYQVISPNQDKISLSSYVPNVLDTGVFILITVDTTGAVVLTAGTPKLLTELTLADMPAPPEGTKWLLAAVRLYSAQIEIAEGITNTDIVDLRYPLYDGQAGGGGVGDMSKAVYDQNDNGIVDNAEALQSHPASDFSLVDHTHSYSSHASRHMLGGEDELDLNGLAGLLSEQQDPIPHKTRHQAGGSDQLDVTGLHGILADLQTPTEHGQEHGAGGRDELELTGLSGLLATPQTPTAHAASHMPGGPDPISIAPASHATNHQAGGSDAIKLDTLALPDDTTTLNASTSRHGLMPKLVMGTSARKYTMRGNGGWEQDQEDELVCGGRLSNISNSPDLIENISTSATVYYTPYLSKYIGLMDITRTMKPYQFPELFVQAEQPFTGNIVAGSTRISNPSALINTIVIGCQMQGSGIPLGTKVSGFDLTTNEIIMDQAAIQTASNVSITPHYDGLPFDIFAYPQGEEVKLLAIHWLSSTNRNWVASSRTGGAIFRTYNGLFLRYLGVAVPNGSGCIDNKLTSRGLFNFHNRIRTNLLWQYTISSWTTTTATWEGLNGTSMNVGIPCHPYYSMPIEIMFNCMAAISSTNYEAMIGIGVDSTTVNSAQSVGATRSTARIMLTTYYIGVLPSSTAIHKYYPLQRRNGGGTATYVGSVGTDTTCAMLAFFEV